MYLGLFPGSYFGLWTLDFERHLPNNQWVFFSQCVWMSAPHRPNLLLSVSALTLHPFVTIKNTFGNISFYFLQALNKNTLYTCFYRDFALSPYLLCCLYSIWFMSWFVITANSGTSREWVWVLRWWNLKTNQGTSIKALNNDSERQRVPNSNVIPRQSCGFTVFGEAL